MPKKEKSYLIEKLLDAKVEEGSERKVKGKKLQSFIYHIRWKGYGADSDTWQPEEEISSCRIAIINYWRNRSPRNDYQYWARLILNEFMDDHLNWSQSGLASRLGSYEITRLCVEMNEFTKRNDEKSSAEIDEIYGAHNKTLEKLYNGKFRIVNEFYKLNDKTKKKKGGRRKDDEDERDTCNPPTGFVANQGILFGSQYRMLMFQYKCDCKSECGEDCLCMKDKTVGNGEARCHTKCSCSCEPPVHAKTVLERTPNMSWHLLADEPIKAGQIICDVFGKIVASPHAEQLLEARPLPISSKSLWPYFVSPESNKMLYLDLARYYSPARFIAHHCEPNCRARYVYKGDCKFPHLEIVATKNISDKSRILLDYFPEEGPKSEQFAATEVERLTKEREDYLYCQCEARDCKRILYSSTQPKQTFKIDRKIVKFDMN